MIPEPSARQRSFVTTIGGSAHFAAAGLSGIFTENSGFDGTRAMYAIHLPSGDHVIPLGASFRLVISASCPVSIQRTQICGLPLRFERYAMRDPSGDQRGEPSLKLPCVMGRWPLPSASAIQMLL